MKNYSTSMYMSASQMLFISGGVLEAIGHSLYSLLRKKKINIFLNQLQIYEYL